MRENLEGEVWRDVVGYEGLYQVSNMGRVYSMPREWVSANGGKRSHKGKIMNQSINSRGYLNLNIRLNSKCKNKNIHILVAEAFLGHVPCGFKLVVDHINDVKTDNRVENLQIVTHRFNAYKTQGKGTSQYKGVYWHKLSKKWMSRIYINGTDEYLGLFNCELKAHLAYQNKLKEIENGK